MLRDPGSRPPARIIPESFLGVTVGTAGRRGRSKVGTLVISGIRPEWRKFHQESGSFQKSGICLWLLLGGWGAEPAPTKAAAKWGNGVSAPTSLPFYFYPREPPSRLVCTLSARPFAPLPSGAPPPLPPPPLTPPSPTIFCPSRHQTKISPMETSPDSLSGGWKWKWRN